MRSVFLVGATMFCAAFSGEVQGDILVGNYTPSDNSWNVGVSPTQQPTVSFTLPALSYLIDSVTLSLVNYTSGQDAPLVGFYTDNSGQPGTLVGSLLANPSSGSTAAADFTFLPNGTLTLSASTTYWLLVDASAGNYAWNAASTDIPTSRTPVGAASFVAYKVGINNGASYVDDSPTPSFNINATPVPEPSQYAMVAGAGLLGFGLWRRGAGARRN